MNGKRTRHLLIFLLCFCIQASDARDIVVLEKWNKPVEEREALLILPGFGSMYHSLKAQRKAFSRKGYDLFIPDYISRRSIDDCAENVAEFIRKHHLDRYKKIYIFSYIIGSWTLNRMLEKHSLPNIGGIVYDRSPLQERAPAILVKKYPHLSRLVFGKLLGELSRTPYKALPKEAIKIGVLVESKATGLIKKNRKETEAMGPVSWSMDSLRQEKDDHVYLWLNHDELYTQFDVTAPEVLLFFGTGAFSHGAARSPLGRDPFAW